MATPQTKPEYIRHIFTLIKETKSYHVFKISELPNGYSTLTEYCRIEKFFGKSSAKNITHYFRLRTTSNWNTSEQVTGLRHTKKENVFYGDHRKNGKQNLLIFRLSEDLQTLIVDYYRGFYPKFPTYIDGLI